MRKALKATCRRFQVPRQISVVLPDATAISPRAATNFVPFVRSMGAACSWQPVFGKVRVGTDIFCRLQDGDHGWMVSAASTNLINYFQ